MPSGFPRSASRRSTPITAESLVIVFARAPRAGRVKTRLAQRLGAPGAARLHERLVRRTLDTAVAAGCGAVELHATQRHARLRAFGVPLRVQRGRDLGERMHRALRGALRRHRYALLIGTDCPVLAPIHLRRALRWLKGGADVVLAPAEDGGYALIGARRIASRLFESVPWGRAEVLARTIENAAAAALKLRLLATVWDVDRPADLERLRSRHFSLARRRRVPR